MRPIGKFVCCIAICAAGSASAQNNDLNYTAPTIHNSGQRVATVPLPPLSSQTPAPNQGANAAWVSERAPNVVPASYATPIPNANQVHSATTQATTTATRTPLNPPKAQVVADSSKSSSGNTIRMLFSVGSSLLVVIGLFLGVAWCYRKTLNTSIGGLPKHVVKVIGRTAIAPRQQLLLIRFGSKLVLVSMVQGETRTISEITDPLEVDQLAGACESHQPHSLTNSFRSILNQNGGGAV